MPGDVGAGGDSNRLTRREGIVHQMKKRRGESALVFSSFFSFLFLQQGPPTTPGPERKGIGLLLEFLLVPFKAKLVDFLRAFRFIAAVISRRMTGKPPQ